MIDNIQTSESRRMDKDALKCWFSIMNSIPFVASDKGSAMEALKKIPVESFWFPVAKKSRPDPINTVIVIKRPILIRFIAVFISRICF
jgi:hypothetical protein